MSFIGKYEWVSHIGYEDFLNALDVSPQLREAAAISIPIMEVTESNGIWTIKTSTTLKSMELKFKLGERFEDTTTDGREVSIIVTQEGNKFIAVETAKKEGQKSTETVREFLGDKVVHTLKIIGTEIVCIQEYKRI